MGKSNRISDSDAAALLYAVSEAYESEKEPKKRLVRAVTSGCTMVRARLGSICHGTIPSDGAPFKLLSYVEAGDWNETDRRCLSEYYSRQDHEEDLVAKGITDRVRDGGWPADRDHAVLRCEVVSDRRWYRSRHVNDFRKASDLDDCIYVGTAPSPDGTFFGMTFHRPWKDKPFRVKDRVLMDILRRGIVPLLWRYERSMRQADPLDELPPQLKKIAQLLMQGHTDRTIAKTVDRELSTVRSRVHELRHRYGVRTRAEFVALIHRLRAERS
jgi:DNA-binding CsgD family transcriptional regulator